LKTGQYLILLFTTMICVLYVPVCNLIKWLVHNHWSAQLLDACGRSSALARACGCGRWGVLARACGGDDLVQVGTHLLFLCSMSRCFSVIGSKACFNLQSDSKI
jgi:hypothetical protein